MSSKAMLFAIRAASDDLLGWGVGGDEIGGTFLKSKQLQEGVMD